MTTATKKTTKKLAAAAKKAAKVKAEIMRRNKLFKNATAAEKRVLIAQDVITQIKLKRYVPMEGTWVDPDIGFPSDPDMPEAHPFADDTASIRELFLTEKIQSCDCCALGAMFMSCTLYNNQTTVKDFDRETWNFEKHLKDRNFANGLARFFSLDQLKLIEAAFEDNCGAFPVKGAEQAIKASKWSDKYPNDDDRLIAIMRNIVKNDGTFVL